jgi:ribose-phosphate pyrophosphokinase
MKQHVNWKLQYKTENPYILNLDQGFKPYNSVAELEYKTFDFKGGEPHFQITTDIEYFGDLIITQRYNKIYDLFKIILANDAARRMGFKNISLVLPYFPAARQDRVCNAGEPLTIKVFADMINGCGFDNVTILCPHSEVTPALLNNVVVLDELVYVDQIIVECLKPMEGYTKIARKDAIVQRFNIVCPDAGAGKRVGKVTQYLANKFINCEFNLIRCEKVRDVKDGSIKEFFVDADDLKKYPTLIVDDIVCGGNTFKGLGDILKTKNCGKLMLYTTHADYVDGIQNMVAYFDHVYTTNSKRNYDDYTYTFSDRFTCLKIEL